MADWHEIVAQEKSGTLAIPESPPPPVLTRTERRRRATETGYERIIFIPDLHCPYHDRDVWVQVLAFIRDYTPDRIVFLGDVIDAYPVSSFSKDPARKETLQDELDSGHEVLRQARDAAPDAIIDYTPGNHEKRIDRFLWEKAPALASLRCMALGELLRLDELEVRLHDYSGFKLREKFRVTHGTAVRRHAGHSAMAEQVKWGINGISGHTHRAGTYTVSNEAGTMSWTETGHLCDVARAEYVQSPNWQQAIACGDFKRSSNRFQLELVQIARRELVYQGRSFSNN